MVREPAAKRRQRGAETDWCGLIALRSEKPVVRWISASVRKLWRRATRRSRSSGGPNAPPMNPFGAATGLGKANASVDSADATADALARVEVGASSSAGSSVPARSGGAAAAGLKRS